MRLAELGPPTLNESKSVTQGRAGESCAIAPHPWFPHSGASQGWAPDQRGHLAETPLFLDMLVIRPHPDLQMVCVWCIVCVYEHMSVSEQVYDAYGMCGV